MSTLSSEIGFDNCNKLHSPQIRYFTNTFAAIAAAILISIANAANIYAQNPWIVNNDVELDISDGSTDMVQVGLSSVFENLDNIIFQFSPQYTLTIYGDNNTVDPNRVTTIGNITTTNDNTGTLIFNIDPLSSLTVGNIGMSALALREINIQVSGADWLNVGSVYATTLDIADDQKLRISDMSKIGTLNLNDSGSVNFMTDLNPAGDTAYTAEIGTVDGGLDSMIATGRNVFVEIGGGTFGILYCSLQSDLDNRDNGVIISGDTIISNYIFTDGAGIVTIANNATLTLGGNPLEMMSFLTRMNLDNGTTLKLGDHINGVRHDLEVAVWESNGTLAVAVDTDGWASMLMINLGLEMDTALSGTTTVTLEGNTAANLNKMGDILRDGLSGYHVWDDDIGDWVDAGYFMPVVSVWYSKVAIPDNSFVLQPYTTSRYVFNEKIYEYYNDYYDVYSKDWGYTASPYVALTDVSTLAIANIVAFELPRAQYINGPWAVFKGGELNDPQATFRNHSYQDLQVGWEKKIIKNLHAGLFFEANWMYGKGVLRSLDDDFMGNLRSTNEGLAGGFYVSQTFRNKTYFDVVGRVTRFENDINYYDANDAADNYSAQWTNNMFTLGMEFGKTFSSRDNRWSFRPYNRLIYNSASAKDFDITYNNSNVPVHVNLHGFGTWTNRLGGRLVYNPSARSERYGLGYYGQSPCDLCGPDPCDPCGGKSWRLLGTMNKMYFVSTDYYQGLSGKFGTSFYDPTVMTGFEAYQVAHPKNNMAYGVASAGMSLFPRENVSVSFVGQSLFGDVNGYGLTVAGKVTF